MLSKLLDLFANTARWFSWGRWWNEVDKTLGFRLQVAFQSRRFISLFCHHIFMNILKCIDDVNSSNWKNTRDLLINR